MSDLVLELDEEFPEQFQWIKKLKEQRRPALNALLNLCARVVASNLDKTLLDVVSDQSVERQSAKPKVDVFLPLVLSQTIFNDIPIGRRGGGRSDAVAAFASSSKPNPLALTSLDLWGSGDLDDRVLEQYLKASSSSLHSLNISHCPNLRRPTLGTINKYGSELRSLVVGNSFKIFSVRDQHYDGRPLKNGSILFGPKKLERLVIWGVAQGLEPFYNFFKIALFNYNDSLIALDLGGCFLRDFDFLTSLRALKSLSLYNVKLEHELGSFFPVVGRLSKTITHLDISQPSSRAASWGSFEDPDKLLGVVVRALDSLTSLDISGTNLAGDGASASLLPNCDIPGLNSRLSRRLEYLGLYAAAHSASHRASIPAKLIGEDRDKEQLVNAARAFIHRPQVLRHILNDLSLIFRREPESGRDVRVLALILLAMERHPGERKIQILASATLHKIIKGDGGWEPLRGLKRRILCAIVDGLEAHSEDPKVMANGCLTICHFAIPQDIMFLFERLTKVLLKYLGAPLAPLAPLAPRSVAEQYAVYLLNSFVSQVERGLFGDLGAIEILLDLIRGQLNGGECDGGIEAAWSALWNMTDETPGNCHRFVQKGGLGLFLHCFKSFPQQPELLRNMTGVLGNVAEVANLRSRLMTAPSISSFYKLLNPTQEIIEVSHQAAGVLANLLSDGESAWNVVGVGVGVGVGCPTRPQICQRIRSTLNTWDIHSPREIGFSSLQPILRLLLVQQPDECGLWAAWTLANLTTVCPEVYVKLLKDEGGSPPGGLELLQRMANGDTSGDEVASYAAIAVKNVNKYNQLQL